MEAGWLADPWRRHQLRYWDGDAWTEHVADAGVQTVDPPEGAFPPPEAPGGAEGGGPGSAAVDPRTSLCVVDGMLVGKSIREKKIRKQVAEVGLVGGETAELAVRTNRIRNPMADVLLVTSGRVVLLQGNVVAWQATSSELTGVEPRAPKGMRSTAVTLTLASGDSLDIPLPNGDTVVTVETIQRLIGSPPDDAVATALADAGIRTGRTVATTSDARAFLADVPSYGTKINGPTARAVEDLSDDEKPWMVIVSSTGGCLAAWSDRLAIVKAGGMTGVLTGTTFGGRTTIFHYPDITAIEYNAGLATGVLEVLTASYQGTANKDFWRGTNRGRNADSNDPYTLSNTLPLSKAMYRSLSPQLSELRRRIAESKRPTVEVRMDGPPAPSPAPARSLAAELRELAELNASGMLTDEEFVEAKRRLIAGD